MDKTTRNLIIIGSIVTFVVVPVAAYLILNRSNQPATTSTTPATSDATLPVRTNDELAAAIKKQSPDLAEVPFTISNVAKPQKGWYVVTIHTNDDPQGLNPAKLLLQDTTAGLHVLLGPGTDFPPEDTQAIGVPDNVAAELNK